MSNAKAGRPPKRPRPLIEAAERQRAEIVLKEAREALWAAYRNLYRPGTLVMVQYSIRRDGPYRVNSYFNGDGADRVSLVSVKSGTVIAVEVERELLQFPIEGESP